MSDQEFLKDIELDVYTKDDIVPSGKELIVLASHPKYPDFMGAASGFILPQSASLDFITVGTDGSLTTERQGK